MLYFALRNTNSSGYFALQEAHQMDGDFWMWQLLQAQGGTVISIVTYTLAIVSASMCLIQYSNYWILGECFNMSQLLAGKQLGPKCGMPCEMWCHSRRTG